MVLVVDVPSIDGHPYHGGDDELDVGLDVIVGDV